MESTEESATEARRHRERHCVSAAFAAFAFVQT